MLQITTALVCAPFTAVHILTPMVGITTAGRAVPLGTRESRESRVPQHDAKERQLRLGRYEILGQVAVGGMAELYLAHESVSGEVLRRVAIKVLRPGPGRHAPAWRESFEREGRINAGLVHPNICHVYEFRCEGALSFIAMEWVHGVALTDLMRALHEQRAALPVQLAANIGAQIAAGLEHAHTATGARDEPLFLVHRDVNPSNVMVRYDGVVKLVDFGIAQVEASGKRGPERVVGKLPYMAPEQIVGGQVDARADSFALGVCLYELLTGARVYPNAKTIEARRAALQRPVPPMRALRPDLPQALDTIVMRALARAPSDRYQTAGDLQADLEDYLAGESFVTGARPLSAFMKSVYGERTSMPPLTWNAQVRAALEASLCASRRSTGSRLRGAVAIAKAEVVALGAEIRALTGRRFAFGAAAATAVWGLSLLRGPSAEAVENACLPPVSSAAIAASSASSMPVIEQIPASFGPSSAPERAQASASADRHAALVSAQVARSAASKRTPRPNQSTRSAEGTAVGEAEPVAPPALKKPKAPRTSASLSLKASPPLLSFAESTASRAATTAGAKADERKTESRRRVPFVNSPGF